MDSVERTALASGLWHAACPRNAMVAVRISIPRFGPAGYDNNEHKPKSKDGDTRKHLCSLVISPSKINASNNNKWEEKGCSVESIHGPTASPSWYAIQPQNLINERCPHLTPEFLCLLRGGLCLRFLLLSCFALQPCLGLRTLQPRLRIHHPEEGRQNEERTERTKRKGSMLQLAPCHKSRQTARAR